MAYRTPNIWSMIKKMATGGGTFMYTPFKSIFCDPINGNDAYDGLTLDSAKRTLAAAFALATSGKNDTIFLVANGTDVGTCRVDSSFAWNKDAVHLVGICPGNSKGLRARIAPTMATTAFANFFVHTGKGCCWENIQLWHEFTTGTAAEICLTLTNGSSNRFVNCEFVGMVDAAAAASTSAKVIKFNGAHLNEFIGCTIGSDTVARTVANYVMEFAASGANRGNKFYECDFPMWTTTVQTQLTCFGGTAPSLAGTTIFRKCAFINNMQGAGYLIQTAICTFPASSGGMILFRDCTLLGATGFGEGATTRGFTRIDGGAPTAGGTGLAISPTA